MASVSHTGRHWTVQIRCGMLCQRPTRYDSSHSLSFCRNKTRITSDSPALCCPRRLRYCPRSPERLPTIETLVIQGSRNVSFYESALLPGSGTGMPGQRHGRTRKRCRTGSCFGVYIGSLCVPRRNWVLKLGSIGRCMVRLRKSVLITYLNMWG